MAITMNKISAGVYVDSFMGDVRLLRTAGHRWIVKLRLPANKWVALRPYNQKPALDGIGGIAGLAESFYGIQSA